MVTAAVAPRWVPLVYELLDARSDTACLAHGLDGDPKWAAHLEYLRQLQRVGRELLAHAPTERSIDVVSPDQGRERLDAVIARVDDGSNH
jgi:hypothetical protein